MMAGSRRLRESVSGGEFEIRSEKASRRDERLNADMQQTQQRKPVRK